jgi:hypothetical protein
MQHLSARPRGTEGKNYKSLGVFWYERQPASRGGHKSPCQLKSGGQREADRKIKRKVDLLAEALARPSGGPWHTGHGRGRGNP